jgi:streptomycin 6-kinase
VSTAGLLSRWGCVPDGPVVHTATSTLVPAYRDGLPVMLKTSNVDEEVRGNALMVHWAGRGAARVVEHDGETVLMERATGIRSLGAMAAAGGAEDDAATRVLCRVAATLHAVNDAAPTACVPLTRWFRGLFEHAEQARGFFADAAAIARELLEDQREVRVLHGDLHHGNVLDFTVAKHPRTDGWLAIDPKALVGERTFDFANVLCNPDRDVALRAGRLERQLEVIADEARLDSDRLLRWTIAWCGLSSSWYSADGGDPGHPLEVGARALAHLG